MLVHVEKDILDYFHVDVVDVERSVDPSIEILEKIVDWKLWVWEEQNLALEIPGNLSVKRVEDGYIVSNGKTTYKMSKSGFYFDNLYRRREARYPLRDVRSVEDVKGYNWDQWKVSDEYLTLLRKRAEYLYRNTEYGLIFAVAANLHEWIQIDFVGFAEWLSMLRIRRALAEAILDHVMEVARYNTEKYVEAIGDYVQVIGFADDFGTEICPQISVQTFREMYKHRWEELFDIVKKRSKAFIFFHSCGSIYPLIRELIDIGLDILNPVQISAKGMDPEKLKKEFGDQLTFWGGGVDTQHILPLASPERVVEHVKKLIRIFAPKGGFVYASVHNIQPGVPPENIVAMFKTAYEYGRYPIS